MPFSGSMNLNLIMYKSLLIIDFFLHNTDANNPKKSRPWSRIITIFKVVTYLINYNSGFVMIECDIKYNAIKFVNDCVQ